MSFQQEVRPYEEISSAPSQVQEAVSSFDIPGSEWGTVLTLVLADLMGWVLVYGGGTAVAAGVGAPAMTGGGLEGAAVVGGGLLVFAMAGLYQRRFSHPALEMQRMGTLVLTMGVVSAGTVLVGRGQYELALVLLGGGVLGAITLPVCRTLVRILCARADWWGFPAVIIGSGGSGRTILSTLNRWPEIGVRPVAFLSDTADEKGLDVPVQGSHQLVAYLAKHFDIPYALLAMPHLTHAGRANRLAHYSKFFDHVVVMPDADGAPALWTTGRSGDGLFGYGVQNVALRPGARLVKRLMDVCGALLGLILLAPVLAVIALLIRMDSAGSILYRQERMGRDGRIITIQKFRTMYVDADQKLEEILATDPERRREYERYHKLEDDPRVTPIGKTLRRYSLDELPQLLNVLWGDMSLVGPRAYMPSELNEMNGLTRAVLQSRPGMTGLWQVSGRNELSFADRVNLDVHYIQNWSPWLDLYVLIRTGPVVCSGEGAS